MPSEHARRVSKEPLRQEILRHERARFRSVGFDWFEIHKSLLYPLLNIPSQNYQIESDPSDIFHGDLILTYWRAWNLLLATNRRIGYRQIYFTGQSSNPFVSIERATPPDYRLTKRLDVEAPPLIDTIQTLEDSDVQPYLSKLPDEKELLGFQYEVTDQAVSVSDKLYSLRKVQSVSEIKYSRDNGELADDYLFVTNRGIPIIISDFHQKLALHIGLMIAHGLLANVRPIVDWIDEHADDEYDSNISTLKPESYSLSQLRSITAYSWCAQAASILHFTQLARLRTFSRMTIQSTPFNYTPIDPFLYTNPFSRPSRHRPHILSFDLDQVPNFCRIKSRGKSPHFTAEIDQEDATSYFSWLAESGMNSSNYDAVFIYTSPGYINKSVAHDAMLRTVRLFHD